MAMWKEGLPSGIQRDTAHVILLINVICPGVGTIVSAALSSEYSATTIIVGIAQLVTMFIVVGYVWAIAWSVMLIKKASGQENEPLLPRRETVVDPPGTSATA